MKNRILINFGTALLITGIFSACSKEQKVTLSDTDNIAQQLKFVQVNESKKGKPGTLNRERIIIVQWEEWGRAKKDCEGWGLCNAEWFPQFNDMIINPNPIGGGASILEYDHSNNEHYFDIMFASKPPESIPLLSLTLIVDYDIVLDTQTRIGTNLKINQGMYYYDSSIGDHGGYRIYLEII